MARNTFDIYVYAHWQGMPEPKIIGILAAHYAKGKKAFSFEYGKDWIKSEQQLVLDPDIQFYSGPQYPNNKENLGVFLDSMPDTWGRTLMKRRATQLARDKNEKAPTLFYTRSIIYWGFMTKAEWAHCALKPTPADHF